MSVTDTLSPEEIRARRERRRHWFGYLADENVEHVAARIERILTGRTYTWVANNTALTRSVPDVRTGQRIKPRSARDGVLPRVYRKSEEGYCGITVCDTYGVWGIHSSHATEAEAREDERDEKRRNRVTFVSIEGGHEGDQPDRAKIEIHQYNGLGELMHWVIAVEPTADVAGDL